MIGKGLAKLDYQLTTDGTKKNHEKEVLGKVRKKQANTGLNTMDGFLVKRNGK